MDEATGEISATPAIPQQEAQGISRRQFIATSAAVGGIASAAIIEQQTGFFSKTAGIIGRAVEGLFSRSTEQQRLAAQKLERNDVTKFDYTVKDVPDIRETQGLAVRKEPNIPPKGDPPTTIYRLQPGDKITNAIEWPGQNYRNAVKPEGSINWLAFKDQSGRVGFVANDDRYLEPITKASNP